MRLLFLSILLLTLSLNGFAKPEAKKKCDKYFLTTFELNMTTKSIIMLGKSKDTVEICGSLYESGKENVILEVKTTVKPNVFKRKLFINFLSYYDYIEKGRTKGGVVKEPKSVFTAHIPTWTRSPAKLFLKQLKGKFSAKGTL